MRTIVIDEKKNINLPKENEKMFFADEFNALETKSCFYDFATQNKVNFYWDESKEEKSIFVKKIEEMFKR